MSPVKVREKVILIDNGSTLVNWLKCIFPEDPYWKVTPVDVMRNERFSLMRDDLIQIGDLKYKRTQWLGYTFGILVSGSYYELRFDEYYKNKTSVRLIFSPNLRTFVEWIENHWLKINYTISSDRHSWDFKTIVNKLVFINPEWWAKKQRTEEVIYLRFSPYGSNKDIARIRYEEAKKVILDYFDDMFNGIDREEFLYFFQKGVDCLPIDMLDDKVITTQWSKIRSRGRIFNFCQNNFPKINTNIYESSVLLKVIGKYRTYLYHDIKNSGYFKYILLDPIKWGCLNRADYSYVAVSVEKKGEANKVSFSKDDKRYIFKKYGFKVFNKKHCFSDSKYFTSEVYVVNTFCQNLYNNEEWKQSYGGTEEVCDLIDQFDPKFLKKKFRYKKEHTIEMNHFPMLDTYASCKTEGYAMYDRDLVIPMFSYDHMQLNGCKDEADQLRVFLKKGWFTKEEAVDFCIKIMKIIKKIETERKLGNELSELMRIRFCEILGSIKYV